MNHHPRWRPLQPIMVAIGSLIVVVAGIFFFDISRDANAQNPTVPNVDSVEDRSKGPLAAGDNNSCIEAVQRSYARIGHDIGGDSVLRYTCRVETVMADTAVPMSVADVHISVNSQRLQVSSEFFEFYRDSVSVFTVIPGSRTIYRSDPDPTPQKGVEENMFNPEWIRDSILLKSRVLECSTVVDSAGRTLRTIRLSPDPDLRYYLNLSEILMVLDEKSWLPVGMTIYPMHPELYASVTWRFSDIRVEPRAEVFHTDIVDVFENDRGKLLPSWAGYTLVDNRHEALAARVNK